MTYHDTPSQPMPQKRTWTLPPSTGEKHKIFRRQREQRWAEVGTVRSIHAVRKIAVQGEKGSRGQGVAVTCGVWELHGGISLKNPLE